MRLDLISVNCWCHRIIRRRAGTVYTRQMGRLSRQLLVWWMMLAVPAHALAANVMEFSRDSNGPQLAMIAAVTPAHEGCANHSDPATDLACTICATSVSLIGTLAPQATPIPVTRTRFESSAAPAVIFLTDGLERPPRTSLS